MDYRYIDRSKMRVLEALYISESFYEPVEHIGPIQDRLNGLHQKAEVG
jgi:hypothetical protein